MAAVIPAHGDEAPTIGDVIDAVRRAGTVDEVIVIDNLATPETVEAARGAGAKVIECPEEGKGQAMATGVAATEAEVILFLDADLIGLTPDHVDRLVGAVGGRVGMSMGLFDRGPAQNWLFLNTLPILSGQRALWRQLFEALDPAEYEGYKVEAALNSLCAALNVDTEAFVCEGLWHRTKEEKLDTPATGFAKKQAMLVTAGWGYVNFRLRRLLGRRRREIRRR